MKTIICLFALVILINGCAHSNISKIDDNKAAITCARECVQLYSQCVSDGPKVRYDSFHYETCKENYHACTQACPTK